MAIETRSSCGQMQAQGQRLAEHPLLVFLAERSRLADRAGPLFGSGGALQPRGNPFARRLVQVPAPSPGRPAVRAVANGAASRAPESRPGKGASHSPATSR